MFQLRGGPQVTRWRVWNSRSSISCTNLNFVGAGVPALVSAGMISDPLRWNRCAECCRWKPSGSSRGSTKGMARGLQGGIASVPTAPGLRIWLHWDGLEGQNSLYPPENRRMETSPTWHRFRLLTANQGVLLWTAVGLVAGNSVFSPPSMGGKLPGSGEQQQSLRT